MQEIIYSKRIQLEDNFDVIVVGGGPAGICAAVAAARFGVKTALIERYGMLGGNLTSGQINPILGRTSPGTMRDELIEKIAVMDESLGVVTSKIHSFERTKRIITEFVNEAGVKIYLQTPFVDVLIENKKVRGILAVMRNGLKALSGKIVIDASGDGDVAYSSGAEYSIGRDSDGLTQPLSLSFVLSGVDEDAIYCLGSQDNVLYKGEGFREFTARCCEMGLLPPNTGTVRLHHTGNPTERGVNTTQVNGLSALIVNDIVKAELILRSQIDAITEFLRNNVEGFRNCYVKTSASTLGIRETRRFTGEYVLNDEDIRVGRKHKDVVVHNASFIVDIHNPLGSGQAEGQAEHVKPYDIPYRCLVPRAIDNLLLAGRCISGTHRAHASYRVMSICMAIGEAVGLAGALAVRHATTPRLLDYRLIQEALLRKNIELFD